MSRTTVTTTALIVLVWAALMSFGGVAAETVMLYPNIFADPPASLDRAREFLVAGGPSDYFPPLGATVVLTSLVTVALTWRNPRLRWWVAGAATVFVAGHRVRLVGGAVSAALAFTALLRHVRATASAPASPANDERVPR